MPSIGSMKKRQEAASQNLVDAQGHELIATPREMMRREPQRAKTA